MRPEYRESVKCSICGWTGNPEALMARTDSANAVNESAELTLKLIPRLTRWAQTRVVNEEFGTELSLRQLSALQMIEDETTTLGDVARRLMVTPAVVTGLIDRLEKRGYVRRINSTDDRRRVLLALTDEGRAAAESVSGQLQAEMATALSGFSASDLEQLDRSLSRLRPVASELERSSPDRRFT